jgi:hypothetical protein
LLPTTIYHFSTLGIVWSLFVDGPPTDEFLKNALAAIHFAEMYCGRKNLLNSGASAKYSQTLKASQANFGANFISVKDCGNYFLIYNLLID